VRIAVCEAAPDMMPGDGDWQHLVSQVGAQQPDIFLLNEMPFGPWLSGAPEANPEKLAASRQLHDEGLSMMDQLGVPAVLSTRPIEEEGGSVNQAFVWREGGKVEPVHTKQFFPQEEGYYESSWFTRGETHFRLADVQDLRVGFLICTEVMFNEWARYYGRQGAHIIAVPRAVGRESLWRWKTVLSMAAIVSGCYVITSNRTSVDRHRQVFGGGGWIFDPFGHCIAETSTETPAVCAEFDAKLVKQAQSEYPCYVKEL